MHSILPSREAPACTVDSLVHRYQVDMSNILAQFVAPLAIAGD